MSCRPSIYDGLDPVVAAAKLQAMQMALLDLQSGAQVATASYSQGDGSRTVSYRATDLAMLTGAIIALQSWLDRQNGVCSNRRKPLRPYFGTR